MKLAQYHVTLSFYASGVDHIGYPTTTVLMFIMDMSMYGMATSANTEIFKISSQELIVRPITKICEKRLLASSFLSVCPPVRTEQLLLDGFS